MWFQKQVQHSSKWSATIFFIFYNDKWLQKHNDAFICFRRRRTHCSLLTSCFRSYRTNIFHVISYNNEDDKWSSTRYEVSKISILLLVTRCQSILNRFLIDENYLGAQSCLLLSGATKNDSPFMFLVSVELFFTIPFEFYYYKQVNVHCLQHGLMKLFMSFKN